MFQPPAPNAADAAAAAAVCDSSTEAVATTNIVIPAPPSSFEEFYLRRLASRSDSRRQRMSFSRTVRIASSVSTSALRNHLVSPFTPAWVHLAPAARLHRGFSRDLCIPGPLTLRMIERVWSSMNSTRTWVTPPREPREKSHQISLIVRLSRGSTPSWPSSLCRPEGCGRDFWFWFCLGLFRTGTAEDAGDLHELDGLLRGIHFD